MMRRAVLLALATIVTSSTLVAQSTSTLEGLVRDEAMVAIAGVNILALDSLTNEKRHAVTNERGFFRIIELDAGRYSVTASIIGRRALAQPVELKVGERSLINFVLEPAPSILQTVSVNAERTTAATINRTSVYAALTKEEIDQLPLNTRNVMDLAGVTPGIRSFQPIAGHSLPGAGALRDERTLNLYVDGVEMKNFNSSNVVGSPQSGSLLPVDGLQDFTVLHNPYDAEYTRGASYIISVSTQRGTNETHGSSFGFFQNRDLISVNHFQRGIPNFEKPDFRRSQAGFSLRGPVVRDRLFYAASYEISDAHNYVAVVPGQPATDPSFWDRYGGVFDSPSRNQAGVLHLTYAANEANTIETIASSRYFTAQAGFGGIVASEFATDQKYTVNTVNVRHRWLPSSGLGNELSLQLVRWHSDNSPITAGPQLRYPTLTLGGDTKSAIYETQIRLVDRLTYAVGSGPRSHLVKAGLEVGHAAAEQFTPTNGNGVFRFKAETGEPFEGSIGVGVTDPFSDRDARATLSGLVVGAYLNDEWHPTSRLILNVGIRYDADINTMNNRFTVPWISDTSINSRPELKGLLNHGNRRDDLDNISPRFSFSWDIAGTQRVFVRGGFGIIYDRIPGFAPFAERLSATWRNYTFTNPGTIDPAELRTRVASGGGTPVAPAITLLPDRMDVPENRQWSLGLGAQLTRVVALNMDYIDQNVQHLFALTNLNWLDVSKTPATRAISKSYGNIMAWRDFARARYRALLTSVSFVRDAKRRVTLAYTLASAKADWDVESVNVPTAQASRFYVMQRTSGDERHRFVFSGAWPVRYGIALSTIATAASPRPYRTWVGQDLNNDNILPDDWIDGIRYGVPKNTWANWYREVDVRVTKGVNIGHRAQLSLIVEAFNLFNTENYSGYFGVQRAVTGEPRPDFGTPSGTFATRQLQLGSKIQF